MIFLSKNLKFLRKKQGMGQSDLAKHLDIKSNTISNYENEVSAPDYSILEKIVSFFHISAHDILYTDIEAASQTELSRILINKESDSVIQNKKTLYNIVADVDHEYVAKNITSIPIVDVSAAAGYGRFNSDNPEKLGELSFPTNFLQKKYGNYYCGRVNGDSMEPTLSYNDWIIFRLLSPGEWGDIKSDNIYFIINRSGEGIVKRVKNRLRDEGILLCQSDNHDKKYRDIPIQADDIANIYYVEWRFSNDMTNINQIYFDRLSTIEDKVENIQKALKKVDTK